MKTEIKKVAVLGSGVMGSRIACHFANSGAEVLLLDIVPKELLLSEEKKGLTLENSKVRNRIVNASLESAVKSNPSPLYSKSYIRRITTGNFEDDLPKISEVDWVIEAVVENLEVKNSVFTKVEKYRKEGSLITSNTSGIPIELMSEGRSEDFKKYFCGTHFFNPPRYLPLLEVIPSSQTQKDVIEFIMDYGSRSLGKTVVLCKDTPAFIGNRIGVYSMLSVTHLMKKLDLTIEEVDKFTGVAIGRPKSATFRTADVVGLDTLVNVAKGLSKNLPEDESQEVFSLPDFVSEMVGKKWLGAKTKQGFYKKVKNEKGESVILSLDLETKEYTPQKKVKSATLELSKTVDSLPERLKMFEQGKDKAGVLFRASHYPLFEYISKRVPEIADDFYQIDAAMRAGFGWELGPFEIWDVLGVKETLLKIESAEKRLPGQTGKVAAWVKEMLEAGCDSFYRIIKGKKHFYDKKTKTYKVIPGQEDVIQLEALRIENTIWKNGAVSIIDLGDGIINCEFHTKMNTIGGDVIQGIHRAIDLAEKSYKGVVISNEGKNFSAGANIGLIFMMAVEQEYEELNMAVKMFQDTSMRIRYASVPVVVAPFQMTLGGGCEFAMHADFVQMHAETYMGLVEFGVGVIPGGGGSKEFAYKASQEFTKGQITQNILREKMMTIAQAKVSTSAIEAVELGYLQSGKYGITINRDRLLADAKAKAVELARNYSPPTPIKDIKVLGDQGLGLVYVGANSMKSGGYISAHDQKISEKLGWVMCGGDLSEPTEVSEQYLLDLERKIFLELCRERKTLERIQHMLTRGKPLRN